MKGGTLSAISLQTEVEGDKQTQKKSKCCETMSFREADSEGLLAGHWKGEYGKCGYKYRNNYKGNRRIEILDEKVSCGVCFSKKKKRKQLSGIAQDQKHPVCVAIRIRILINNYLNLLLLI